MRGLVDGTGWARLAVGVLLAGLLSAPGAALGQSLKEQIVGAWRLVSSTRRSKGSRRTRTGRNPWGYLFSTVREASSSF